MFYRKNLPGWERVMRVIADVAVTTFGLIGFPGASLGYAAAGGSRDSHRVFRFCPMCAIVGRQAAVGAKRFPGRYPLMQCSLPLVSKGDFAEFS